MAIIFVALWAGNKMLVEKNIKNLDELNKKAVKTKYIPKDGKIDTKAYIVGKESNETIKIIEHKIDTSYKSKTYKEGKINVPH